MRHFFCGLTIVCLSFLSSSWLSSQDAPQRKETVLRMMSYNIRNAMGMDNVTDFERLSNVIIRENPDVVALQEIDSVTHRSKELDVLQKIAQRVNLHYLYAPAIDFDGGKYGIGILSKEKPLQMDMIPLPGREEARTFLVAEFTDYIFACTHLSLTEEDRFKSLEIIVERAQQANKQFILAGDLNAGPDSPFIKAFSEHFEILSDMTQPTFPADVPEVCIDYLAIFKHTPTTYKLLTRYVANAPVESDHRPTVADIEWLKN